MNLQNRTINRYKNLFPNDTMRETSHRTGIQLTRIFRLFNGKPMKVKELEVFDELIRSQMKDQAILENIYQLLQEAEDLFTREEMNHLAHSLERRIKARSFKRKYFGYHTTQSA